MVEQATGDSDWYQSLHWSGLGGALCAIGAVTGLCLSEAAFWYPNLKDPSWWLIPALLLTCPVGEAA